jgi:anti-sigma28 factor (negative regulator of flagellin synthesis)
LRIGSYVTTTAESDPSLNTTTVGKSRDQATSTVQLARQSTGEDTTSVSSEMASVQALTQAAFNTGSRTAKVALLRQAVSSGQYSADPSNTAAALSRADI